MSLKYTIIVPQDNAALRIFTKTRLALVNKYNASKASKTSRKDSKDYGKERNLFKNGLKTINGASPLPVLTGIRTVILKS